MSARIIPFPAASRPRQVQQIADRMVMLSPASAEVFLVRELSQLLEHLSRIGVPDAAALKEAEALEAAVRVAIWRLVLLDQGGVA